MAAEQTTGYLKEAEDRIDWVLSHPGMGDWLKQALSGARQREPVDLLNDLEMLDHLLKRRAEAQIEHSLSRIGHESGGSEQTREKQGQVSFGQRPGTSI